MATYTDNLHLEKPAQSDLYNIDVFNGNADIIDSAMAARALAQNQATIESSSTASRNYAKGDFLVRNGLLYKVTSAIASGGTITPGTNCVATNTGAELTSLNDSFVNATTPTQITATAGTGVTINAQRIYKIGRLAICEFDITTSSSLATNSNILTGCPASIATWEFFGEKTADGSTHTFYATSGGYIRNSGSLPAGTWIADAVYVTYS